jgi:hypothetical protein
MIKKIENKDKKIEPIKKIFQIIKEPSVYENKGLSRKAKEAEKGFLKEENNQIIGAIIYTRSVDKLIIWIAIRSGLVKEKRNKIHRELIQKINKEEELNLTSTIEQTIVGKNLNFEIAVLEISKNKTSLI